MTEEICTSIAAVLAIIAIILKITNKDKNIIIKDKNISGLKQRHIDEILDATWGPKENTNKESQISEDSSHKVSVILVSVPAKNKIEVLKEIREITYLGLKEAKDIIESAPITIIKIADISEANKIKSALERVGATVEIK